MLALKNVQVMELPTLTAADVAELRRYTDRVGRIRSPHTLSALPRAVGTMEPAFEGGGGLILQDLVMNELTRQAEFTIDDLNGKATLGNIERFVRRAVLRLDKPTIMDEFATVTLPVTGKLLKGIKERPRIPGTISYLHGDRAMHEALFQWENTYTVYYLRKRLYAAIMHAIVHNYLDRREYEHGSPIYDDHPAPLEGHPQWTRDKRFMRDWEKWAPPSIGRVASSLQIPSQLINNGENYEIDRPPPPGYEAFL